MARKTRDRSTTPPPLDSELTAPFDIDRLFYSYDAGKVFEFEHPAGETESFREMLERDGRARGIEQVLTLPIMAATWQITGEGKAVEPIRDALSKPSHEGGMSTPMDLVIAQALGAVVYRKAFFEKVFTRDDDGLVVYDKLAWRPQNTCELARDAKTGAFRGFRKLPVSVGINPTPPYDWVYLNEKRSFVYIHGQHRDPLSGSSDLQVALWAHETKQKLRFLWYSFLEHQSLPKTLVRHRDLSLARKAAATIAKLKSRGVAAIESDIRTDVLESQAGEGAAQFAEAIRFLDSESASSVLAGFMDLTSSAASGKGSFALSADQSAFFLHARRAVAKELATSITNFVIQPLVRYNFGLDTPVPVFEFGPLAEASATDLLTMYPLLANSPSSKAPDGFVDLLTERVAEFLDLPMDQVAEAIKEGVKKREEMAAQQQAMEQAQMGNNARQLDHDEARIGNERDETKGKVAKMKSEVDTAAAMVKAGAKKR